MKVHATSANSHSQPFTRITQHPASHTQSSDLAESLSSSHLKPHTACCIPFSMPHMQPCRLGLHSLSCALHPSCKPHTPCCKPQTPCCTHLLMMSLRHLGPRLSTSITLPLAGLALFHTGLHTPQMPPCKPHIPYVRLPSHTVCVGDVFLQGCQQAAHTASSLTLNSLLVTSPPEHHTANLALRLLLNLTSPI